jgi:hypothetical protein
MEPSLLQVEAAATALVNARIGRRGAPPISNALDLLPEKLRDEVLGDAQDALEAAVAAGPWAVALDGMTESCQKAIDLSGVDYSTLVEEIVVRAETVSLGTQTLDKNGERVTVLRVAGQQAEVIALCVTILENACRLGKIEPAYALRVYHRTHEGVVAVDLPNRRNRRAT